MLVPSGIVAEHFDVLKYFGPNQVVSLVNSLSDFHLFQALHGF